MSTAVCEYDLAQSVVTFLACPDCGSEDDVICEVDYELHRHTCRCCDRTDVWEADR